jgi:hypothetical protein
MIAFAFLVAAASVQVTPSSFLEAKEPQIAIDRDHTIYIAYGMGNSIYVSKSIDEGESYASPIKVGELPKLALGMRRGPRIAIGGEKVVITAISHETGLLVAFRSGDNGRTWSRPVPVNDAAGSAREGLHAMAAAPDGTLACTWLDLRSKGTKLYLSTSKDGGASWSTNRLVYESPSGTVCECCHPSIAFDSKDRLFVMFRNFVNGSRDMYLTSSSDLGATWLPATKLGQGTWPLDACPMDGGSFAFDAKGAVQSVWRREGTLYRSGANGIERLFAEGRQAWISQGSAGPFTVWTDGQRILASTPTEKVLELSRAGSDSTVATSPDEALTVAAWTENGIRATRLR